MRFSVFDHDLCRYKGFDRFIFSIKGLKDTGQSFNMKVRVFTDSDVIPWKFKHCEKRMKVIWKKNRRCKCLFIAFYQPPLANERHILRKRNHLIYTAKTKTKASKQRAEKKKRQWSRRNHHHHPLSQWVPLKAGIEEGRKESRLIPSSWGGPSRRNMVKNQYLKHTSPH